MTTNNNVTFKLNNIEIDSFSINPIKKEITPEYLFFEVGLNWETFIDKKEICIRILIKIRYEEPNVEKISVAQMNTSTYFGILNLEEIISPDGSRMNVSEETLATFVNIAYATTRGILLEKNGTSINNNFLILPLISPLSLVQEAKKKNP